MDLTIDIEGYKLNIRAVGIIIHNNKVLFHKSTNREYYALIGGRVKIGEDSKSTVKRELEEELGKEVEVEQFLGIIENFFVKDKAKYHEILFIYKVEFKNDKDKKIETTLENAEGEKNLKYYWIDINELDEYKIVPSEIKKILKEKKYPFGIIVNNI